MTKRKRIGVDLDNTLCIGKHWTSPKQVSKAIPIKSMIKRINKLYRDHFIVIYTARQNFLMSATFQWLDDNGVYYHAVSNRKTPFEILIDDTAVIPKL